MIIQDSGMFFFLTLKYHKIMEEPRDCSEWTTDELFTYAIAQGLIAHDEEFENWMNDRTDLYRMVQDDIDNTPLDNIKSLHP